VIQTVANDGVRITPTIVKAVADSSGRMVPTPAPEQHRVISAATAEAMHPMLEGVVSVDGTAPLAAIPGYRIAGKTGTADRAVNGHYDGSYTSSFVGFAPADAPRLATVVVLQGTGKKDYFGGSTAGPVFKQLMGFALRSTDTPPTGVPFVPPAVYADGRK
jgi:cell division protein FtsI (penicillin-binding protein 3)